MAWFSPRRQPHCRRGRRSYAQPAPLVVRKLEARRVLNASTGQIMLTPLLSDPPPTVNEGTMVTASAPAASGTGTLIYEWSLTQGATELDSGFSSTFTFTAPDDGQYDVNLRVTDAVQSVAEKTKTLDVNNVDPVIDTLMITTPINENDPATLSGTYHDVGALDTHTLVVDWDDSNNATDSTFAIDPAGSLSMGDTFSSSTDSAVLAITGVDLATGKVSFSVQHQYLDDGISSDPFPSNDTPSDSSTVKITVTDDDLGEASGMVNLTVSNVAPELSDVSATDTPENGSTTLTGSYTDIGLSDVHTLTVDWDDPNNATDSVFTIGPTSGLSMGDTFNSDTPTDTAVLTITNVDPSTGKVSFSVQHQYLDDGTSSDPFPSNNTLSDMSTLTVTVADDDMGSDSAMPQITVSNLDPVIDTLSISTPINENDSATLSGTYHDPGTLDAHRLDIDWDGDGSYDQTVVVAGGTFSVDHTYLDDPAAPLPDTFDVHVRLRDDDMGETTDMVSLTVNNLDPIVTATGNKAVDEGEFLDLTGADGAPYLATFTDFGTLDTHTATVDWGDGSMENATVVESGGSGTVSASHTYADDGVYTVVVTVMDDDEGSHFDTFDVTVGNVVPTFTDGTLTSNDPAHPGDSPSAVTINENESVSFSVDFSDPGFDNPLNTNPTMGPTLGDQFHESFTYFIDWGDGRQQVASSDVLDTDVNGMPMVDSTGSFSNSHTYADDGVYTITIRLADDNMTADFSGGADGTDYVERTFTVTVLNVDPTLTGTTNLEVNEGQAFTLSGLGVGVEDPGFDNPLNTNMPPNGGEVAETFTSYTIDFGDGRGVSVPVSIDNVANRTSGSPGVTTKAQFTHDAYTYADDGTYTVSITLQDDDGPIVTRTFTITVHNVVPTLTLPSGNQTVHESDDLILPVIATFTDPGFDNTANPNAAVLPLIADPLHESFAYFIDWGDGRDQVSTMPVADSNGMAGTPSSGSFGANHNYADDGVYTVTIRIADDNMSAFGTPANFLSGEAGVDYVQQTFTVTVQNLEPSFVPVTVSNGQGGSVVVPFTGDDVSREGVTTIHVSLTDPGYDNLNNPNGPAPLLIDDPTRETFTYLVQWGDGTVDAAHTYSDSQVHTVTVVVNPGGPDEFTFTATISGSDPIVNLVKSQSINSPGAVAKAYSFSVDWGDDVVNEFELTLREPVFGTQVGMQSTVLSSARESGSPTALTTSSADVRHTYLGPPDPLHPTADISVTVILLDDNSVGEGDTIAISNAGIQTFAIFIDTTINVPRLVLPEPQMAEGLPPTQITSSQVLQTPDVRVASSELRATSDRYWELRMVYWDGTESEGYRLKDEALNDLRGLFRTLPDAQYVIYLVRTENNSRRLVMEVAVRRGRLADISDDSEGTRDRPPTAEQPADQGQPVPLKENPMLEAVPGEVGLGNDWGTAESAPDKPAVPQQGDPSQGDGAAARPAGGSNLAVQNEAARGQAANPDVDPAEQASAWSGRLLRWSAPLTGLGLVVAGRGWSQQVDEAFQKADERNWQRLRRAAKLGRRNLSGRFARRALHSHSPGSPQGHRSELHKYNGTQSVQDEALSNYSSR